jgi:tetratricopeptide (TPR) repeat protein
MVPAQNPLAESFKVVAAGLEGPIAETPQWLRVHAAAVVDDWSTVRDDGKKLTELFPLNADAHLAFAVGLEGTGDHEGAVSALRRAVELNPQHLTGWLMLVQMNFRLDRLQDAAKALEQAQELAPDNVEVLMSLAKAYVRLGDAERASIVLSGATKAAPDNVEAWVNYLAVSSRTRRSDAAWREFDQLKSSNPAVAASVQKLLPAGVAPSAPRE